MGFNSSPFVIFGFVHFIHLFLWLHYNGLSVFWLLTCHILNEPRRATEYTFYLKDFIEHHHIFMNEHYHDCMIYIKYVLCYFFFSNILCLIKKEVEWGKRKQERQRIREIERVREKVHSQPLVHSPYAHNVQS